jgi:hypothetical protein
MGPPVEELTTPESAQCATGVTVAGVLVGEVGDFPQPAARRVTRIAAMVFVDTVL